jgi:hypothetical protein
LVMDENKTLKSNLFLAFGSGTKIPFSTHLCEQIYFHILAVCSRLTHAPCTGHELLIFMDGRCLLGEISTIASQYMSKDHLIPKAMSSRPTNIVKQTTSVAHVAFSSATFVRSPAQGKVARRESPTRGT